MQQAIDMEELMTSDEAMKYLRISRPTAMRWLKEGKLPGHKVGARWRFYRSELRQMVRDVKPEQGEAS